MNLLISYSEYLSIREKYIKIALIPIQWLNALN